MRALSVLHLSVCLVVAAATGARAPYARAAEAAPIATPSAQPVVEVAAFGAAPVTRAVENSQPHPDSGDILYRRAPPPEQGEQPEIETRAASGETWFDLFSRVNGTLNAEVMANPAVTRQIDLLPALSPGKFLRLRSAPEMQTVRIDYVVDPKEAYSILLNRTGIDVQRHAADPRLMERMRADPSKASLFTAAEAIGLPEEIVLQLGEIFSDDVDFFHELADGYRCTVAYEARYREGHIEGAGRILAAEFQIRERRIEAYYFDDGNGRSGYFTETGKSFKKAFRKSPVEFSRITSEYTSARFHPILGIWRAHRGIDYAAPLGSKVLAAADGIVNFMGPHGELGNLIILKHFGRYETYYGHLSGFAKGLAVGSAVKKGGVIGYVGMTGLTTGPHVHYEFRIDDALGRWVSVPMPRQLEVPPLQSADFTKAVQVYRDMFEVARKTHFMVLE